MAHVLTTDSEVVEALAEIAGNKSKGQQRERRWFHPFPARMPLAIVEHLIGSLTHPRAVVLDPMLGSGSTLIGAKRLGRTSVGFDCDELATFIARSAVESFSRWELESAGERIFRHAHDLVEEKAFRLPARRKRLPSEDQEFLKYCFPSRAQKELFALASVIAEEPDQALREFAWVVFSSLIIAKQAGASHAMDISRSRPHRREDQPVALPLDAWPTRFQMASARLPFLDQEPGTPADIQQGDARRLSLANESVDFVLTSPPYRNAIDYMRAHKFSLVWMGHDLASLRRLRGEMIGTERGLWERDGLPTLLEDRLSQRIDQPRRRARTRRYLCDLRDALGEIARVLCPGGLAVLVMGPTILSARKTDAAETLRRLGEPLGLRHVGDVARQISGQRRSLPPPGNGGNRLDQRLRREVVVALRKEAS